MAQLDLPCDSFERDDSGAWYATQQVTVGTAIGLIEVMPGHPVSAEVTSWTRCANRDREADKRASYCLRRQGGTRRL